MSDHQPHEPVDRTEYVVSIERELEKTKAAVIDAALIHAKLIQERDEARAEVARMKAEEAQGVKDYLDLRDAADKAISERERAKNAASAYWHDLMRIALLCNQTDDEYPLKAVERTVRDFAKSVRERDEARAEVERLRRDLGAILAVIHRDGGHHTDEHGLSQSVADAHATWAAVVRERDEARAEIERLRAQVRSVDRSTDYNGKAFESDGESSQEDLAIVASERDEARADRERLRRERDYALAEVSRREREHDALVETAQKSLAIVASERDEARAEVERLREALSYL